MEHTKVLGWIAAMLTFGCVACNNGQDSTSANDSTNADTTAAATSSTNNYSAQADSFKANSESGHYLDAKTGKKIKIKVDPSTGARTNEETGEPVSYYVDDRSWKVYGKDSWDTIGTARMEGNKLQFRDDNGKWITFDKKYQMKEEVTKMKSDDDEIKIKGEDTKVKVEKDGDAKVKTDEGKIKVDEDGVKVKKEK